MTQHKPWDRIKVTRIFLLLLLDILLINLSSFLALFTRMELDLTALLESGFLDSIYRYALMDTVCTILIFWFFREYNLIKFPQRGVCLYKCGNERYLLEVHAPAYKEKLFGSAGGR